MKKILLGAAIVAAMGLASCGSITKTATTLDIESGIASYSIADLDVAQKKITYVYRSTSSERRGSDLKKAAVADALKANGNADVLVAPQYVINHSTGEVTVTGYPAFYKNFRPASK